MSTRAVRGRGQHDEVRPPSPQVGQGRDGDVRTAAWVWELNDVRSAPHIFAGGFAASIAAARSGGGDVAARLRLARAFVATLVEAGTIRPSETRVEPRTGLEKFADAVDAALEARAGARLGTRHKAHQQIERLQVELNDLAVQHGERLRRPRPLQVVTLSADGDAEYRRLLDRINSSSDAGELQAAWRLTAARQREAAVRLGPASERSLSLTRGLEALTTRLRVLGVEPPRLDRPTGRER